MGKRTTPPADADEFFEEDEPVVDVMTAYLSGTRGVTAAPSHQNATAVRVTQADRERDTYRERDTAAAVSRVAMATGANQRGC